MENNNSNTGNAGGKSTAGNIDICFAPIIDDSCGDSSTGSIEPHGGNGE